jgi:hypothetical protein
MNAKDKPLRSICWLKMRFSQDAKSDETTGKHDMKWTYKNRQNDRLNGMLHVNDNYYDWNTLLSLYAERLLRALQEVSAVRHALTDRTKPDLANCRSQDVWLLLPTTSESTAQDLMGLYGLPFQSNGGQPICEARTPVIASCRGRRQRLRLPAPTDASSNK